MQNIFIYPGAIQEVQTTLMNLKPSRVFLVTGKKSFEKCGAEGRLKWLFENYKLTHFNDFETDPSLEDVERGVQLFNAKPCDLIISVGGGSAIDMAKLINYYHHDGEKKLAAETLACTEFSPVKHLCLPTTAGSGSESTHFAVIYIGDKKFSIAHPELIPDFAIIDSELHYSQTPYQKAVSGVDALAQAIESFWSTRSTEESRVYSEKALGLIWDYLPATVNTGDKIAHLNIAIGANMAGRAINIAKTTAAHAMSYGFTKQVGLPHGHAVALTLAYFLELHSNVNDGNCNDLRGVAHVQEVMNKIISVVGSRGSLEEFFQNNSIEIDTITKEIPQSTLQVIVDSINEERLANNPLKVNKAEIIKYLSRNAK